MISVLLWLIYLCGVLVAVAGASVAADLFPERGVPFTARTGVIVFAGVLWPVLLVGLLQLVCIAGLAAAVKVLHWLPSRVLHRTHLNWEPDRPSTRLTS
jgi:hypothetical protein